MPDFSKHWKIAVALAVLWLAPLAAPGIETTHNGLTVTWHIAEIPDGEITYTGLFKGCPLYAANLAPQQSYSVSMSVVNGPVNTNAGWAPQFRYVRVDIPFSTCLWRSQVNWNRGPGDPTMPPSMNLTHRDPYAPNRTYNMIEVRYLAGDMNTNTFDVNVLDACIWIIPRRALELGYWRWLEGLPEYAGFEPPVKYHKPDGCGGCTPMGLPGFRVNTATLNLVVEDTDFVYDGLGPEVRLSRAWNADPAVTGWFGRGWSSSYEAPVSATPVGVLWAAGTGTRLSFATPESAIRTNASGEDIPIYDVTNAAEDIAMQGVVYSTNWHGDYEPADGWRMRLMMTQDVSRGVWVCRVNDPDTRLTRQYESTNRFDGAVRMVAISDMNSNRLTFFHSPAGLLTNLLDAAGRLTTFRYDAQGHCTNLVTPGGGTCVYRYDTNHNLIESRDPAGNSTLFRYNAQHYMTNMVTEGRTWTFLWETGLYTHVAAVMDPLGRTSSYWLIGTVMTNRLVWRDAPDGGFWSYLSSNGMTTVFTDPLSRQQLTAFSNARPTAVTRSPGCTRTMSYNERGLLVRRVDEDGSIESWGHNEAGQVTAATNALGHVMRWEYDARGQPTRVISPGGREKRWQYNALGLATAVVDAAGNRTTMEYNPLGRLVRMTDPLGYSSTFGYDAAGLNLVAVTNRRGFASFSEYDALRRVTRVVRADGTSERRVYDCCAEVQLVDGNSRTTTVERNAMLWPTASTDPLGRRTTYTYDTQGKITQRVDPLARTNSYGYDRLGRMTNQVNALGHALYYRYDGNDNLAAVSTDPVLNNFYYFSFDCMNRLQSATDPLFHSMSYQYDAAGRLTNFFNARFQKIAYRYDPDSLQIGAVESGQTNVYAYGPSMRLTNFANAVGSFTYAYDARGDVAALRYPGGLTVTFTRDANGNVAAMTYPDGTVVYYSYDARDRVTNMAWGAHWIRWQYDAENNPLRELRSNGGETLWGYDGANRTTGLLHRVGASNLLQLAYQRDVAGQTTNIVKQSGLIPWAALQIPATNRAWFDAANQMTQFNASACSYDADGNMTGGPGFTATYDAANRIASITRNGTNSAWSYDALGRRAVVVTGASSRRFHYDHADRLLFETDAANRITATYFYRGRALVAAQFRNKGTHFYHFDKNGSTAALTDELGKLSALYRYSAYGEPAGSYSRVPNPFTFIGRYGVMDEGSGLYLMKHRVYDARAGRFLQRDPLGLYPDPNLYAYAGGNPADRTDPEGLEEDEDYVMDEDPVQSEIWKKIGDDLVANAGKHRPASWIVSDDNPRIYDIIAEENPDLKSGMSHEELLDELDRVWSWYDRQKELGSSDEQKMLTLHREWRIWCLMEELPGLSDHLDLGPESLEQVAGISSHLISRGTLPKKP